MITSRLICMPTYNIPVICSSNPVLGPPESTEVLDLSSRKRSFNSAYLEEHKFPETTNLEHCVSPGALSGQSESSDTSTTDSKDLNSNYGSFKCKQSRPFKTYLKDPLSMSIGSMTDDLLGKDSSEAYTEFRHKMLSQVQSTHNGTNKNMRRNQNQNSSINDPSYWEKRKKNNEAAKRSRDARRAKEDEIAIRCAFLEQENIQLKFRLANLESERARLQKLLYP